VIELAIFDIAGTTLYDPDGVGRCVKAALTAANVPWTHEQLNGMMGIPKPVVIASVLDSAGLSLSVEAIHEDFRSRMIDYYVSDPEVREIEGASALFKLLNENGRKVALDTGFDRQIVETILDRLHWRDLVDFTVASDEVEKGRPAPDLVYRCMECLKVSDSNQVAKIGDTPSDLGEGTSAGCGLVIGVTHGTHRAEELIGYPHTHLADNLADVGKIILEA
jgi:phosphonatase-like hydrolase